MMAHDWSKPGMHAQSMRYCFRLLRDTAVVIFLCLAAVSVAKSAQETPPRARRAAAKTHEVSGAAASAEVSQPSGTDNPSPAPADSPTPTNTSSPISSATPMSSAELASQLS